MKIKINPAVKSMTELGLYLIGMILLWIVIAQLVFPDGGREKDAYAEYIRANEPLLTQVAENAMDESVWPGLRETEKVQEVLKEGGVADISPIDSGAAFWLKGENAHTKAAYVYRADEGWPMPNDVSGESWTEVEAQRSDVRHWLGGLGGAQNASVRKLSEHFFLLQLEGAA